MKYDFVCLKDLHRIEEVRKTLQDALEGRRDIPKERIESAQDFLLELSGEINAMRPGAPTRCGGRVIPA
ncbi:hypothetical protein HYT04_00205 [Candidatus Kaiserbacteria bacterium]|nr:hypothetical protein [Candidatus Kaiserbacteria bacterium]